MLPEKIIFIGVVIHLFCSILYIKNIIYGGTKPNLISWFIWALAPFVGFFLQLKAGAGLSSLGIFMAGFGPLLVIAVSLFKKNAFWKVKTFDLICGFISIVALGLYIITHNLGISIFFAVLSDALAYIPTFIKTWKHPETENSFGYLGGMIMNILALLIIHNWIFAIYSFSVYVIIANSVEICFIYRKKFIKKSKIDS